MEIDELVEELKIQMEAIRRTENSKAMSAYMKNLFPFLGIKKPVRETISKPWIKAIVKYEPQSYRQLISELWKLSEREYQYIAMELMWSARKFWQEDHVQLCENLVQDKSWWDTVDFLAARALGTYLQNKPELLVQKIKNWSDDPNLWINRTAILVQLKYKEKTNTELLLQAITPHLRSKEFFHQKAIGWALREYAYTDPAWVMKICDSMPLAPLSRREALKHLK